MHLLQINYKKILFSLPIKLAFVIICCFLFGDLVPEYLKSIFLAISLLIKSSLLFVLPLIIFSFAFHSFAQLKNGLFMFTILLLVLMCSSNFLAVMSAYCLAINVQDLILSSTSGMQQSSTIFLTPSFIIEFPRLCHNIIGLVAGVMLGIYASSSQDQRLIRAAKGFTDTANKFLQNIFIPILPLFIFGFVLKLQHEGSLNRLFSNFLSLLIMTLALYLLYFSLAYWLANGCNVKKAIKAVVNIIPAAIVGFSTMSSAATMPVLLSCAVKNTTDPELTQTLIPSVINNHMVGDALGIPLIALSLYMGEYQQLPDLLTYLAFAFGYILAKFTAAGVPGGTIIVMIPVFEAYLQFTPEMSGVALMLAILFDPFHTTGNIFGNGLFPIIFEKIWLLLKKDRFSK